MLFVFMSQPDFACNPHALYEYIKNHTDHETAWLIKKDERYYKLRERGVRCAVYNTVEGNNLLKEADYVIMNSYTFQRLPKEENQIFVNLWHGSGIKAHDFYNHNINPKHARNLMDFFDKIDLMCVHSLDDRFKFSAQLHFDLSRCYVTGQPRLDIIKKARGREKMEQLFGERIKGYKKYILFVPSFRANSSSHSGTIFSENIFRLGDYDGNVFEDFLKKHQAAFIYKLHPIEQTAFSGRDFSMGEDCFELTDKLLFEQDIRYDELLNGFDVMVSDYSSIVYDYLPLNRPVVYLIPDYEEYISERGFVFHNVDMFMPGEKVFHFQDMMSALEEAFRCPEKFEKEREMVLKSRFDFDDGESADRCYKTIINYRKPEKTEEETVKEPGCRIPSSAEFLEKWIPGEYKVIDSTKDIREEYRIEEICKNPSQEYLYITEEIPGKLRKLTGRSSVEIKDISYYHDLAGCGNVKVCKINGGVDYSMFSEGQDEEESGGRRRRIGFAGVIDNRIYFAMVQCICEVFSDYDIIFAGEIFDQIPVWMDGFENLHYLPDSYEELPSVIRSFDVTLLPFFGRHADTVPKEYFQYLACGKQVVTSDMANLPDSPALYRSASVDGAVKNIRKALVHMKDAGIREAAKRLAAEYDWKRNAGKLLERISHL
ncbi:MAG: hypothetical protein HFI68_05725 [Lachnospiraceae bacterium]|nr:hypothetical protein [Lachnospiraceae bacterium]